ncbi:MAG: carbon storage regulator [Planctomycetota bacterium]
MPKDQFVKSELPILGQSKTLERSLEMLVLSRRVGEEILFPGLGITLEVVEIGKNSARIGIDAPEDIRILRGELLGKVDPMSRPEKPGISAQHQIEIQKRIDAANLAIHLAQNQLRQQLNGHAEDALQNALECLDDLEKFCQMPDVGAAQESVVCEAPSRYRVQSKTALMLEFEPESRIIAKLAAQGYRIISIDSGRKLIDFLQQQNQPDIVIAKDSNGLSDDVQPAPLRCIGVGSLQRMKSSLRVGQENLSCWFSNHIDEAELRSQLCT